MMFSIIHTIGDLPFMYNQNTNSLIIAQKYLTNSFSDIPTNTQPIHWHNETSKMLSMKRTTAEQGTKVLRK